MKKSQKIRTGSSERVRKNTSSYSSSKILCLEHKHQAIIKICMKQSCKYKRSLCSLCMTSPIQKKHDAQHKDFIIYFKQLFQPLRISYQGTKILKQGQKYQSQINQLFEVFQKQFDTITKNIWQKLFTLIISSPKIKSYFQKIRDKLANFNLINFKESKVTNIKLIDQNPKHAVSICQLIKSLSNAHEMIVNLLVFYVFIDHVIKKIMHQINQKIQHFHHILRTNESSFESLDNITQRIEISSLQDVKKVVQNERTNILLNINLENIRKQKVQGDNDGYKSLQKIMKKINPIHFYCLIQNFFNFPDEDIVKVTIPINCHELVFNLNNKSINKKTLENLKTITQAFLEVNLNKVVELSKITILCDNSHLKNQVMKEFSEWILLFKNIETLKVSMKCNNISVLGLFRLMKTIGQFQDLIYLQIDFQGVGQLRNQIGDGLKNISQTIKKLKNLKSLYIGLSNTNLQNHQLIDFSYALSQLPNLQNLHLGLQNNTKLTNLQQAIQIISFSRITNLHLHINGINISMRKLVYIIQALNYSYYLQDASISARNCNLFDAKSKQSRQIRSPKIKIRLSY